jgi:actin-like ATPase involved in cell morphogenesis
LTVVDEDTPIPLGVKLGSTRTVISLPWDGETDDDERVRTIRMLTCLATYEDALTGEERVLYGEDAATEYPGRVEHMLRSGLPENDDSVESARRFFGEVIETNDLPENSVVVYAIPTTDDRTGLENLERIIDDSAVAGAGVRSYPESLCGAIPAIGGGLDALDETFLVVNLGSTNLEVAAYRRGEQLRGISTGAITGDEVDRVIAENVEEETQSRVTIDRTTAREYKESHADFEAFEPFTDVIQQPGSSSHEFTIEWSVMDAVDAYLDSVVDEVANAFLPELASGSRTIYQSTLSRPIVLTGGMACIPGLDAEFEDRLSTALDREITATKPAEPDRAAATGARRIADRLVELEAY